MFHLSTIVYFFIPLNLKRVFLRLLIQSGYINKKKKDIKMKGPTYLTVPTIGSLDQCDLEFCCPRSMTLVAAQHHVLAY